MSNSVFKEYPSEHVDDGESKVNSNLMVFINKNGSVSVDQTALQDLLINDAVNTKTSVSVLRLGSPTPSLELEIQQENDELAKESQENENHEENADEEDYESDTSKSKLDTKTNDVPHVSVTIENFYVPEEAKQLASDILNIAGITNPLEISIDYEFQRIVIANDHCYTPYTSPSQRKSTTSQSNQGNLVSLKSPPQKEASKTKAKIIHSKPNKDKSDTQSANNRQKNATESSDNEQNDSELDNDAASESEESYFSPSESENDRDSDLDFNLNDRPSRVRKIPRSKRSKLTTTRGSRKQRQSVTESSLDIPDEVINSFGKKKTSKTQKKIVNNRSTAATSTPISAASAAAVATVGIKVNNKTTTATTTPTTTTTSSSKVSIKNKSDTSVLQETPSTAVQRPQQQPSPKEDTLATGPPALAPLTNESKQTLQQSVLKKERRTPAHVEALFSDMSSLFSSPDIIKKIGGNEQKSTTNTTLLQPPNINTTSSIPNTDNQITTDNKNYFVQLISTTAAVATPTTTTIPTIISSSAAATITPSIAATTTTRTAAAATMTITTTTTLGTTNIPNTSNIDSIIASNQISKANTSNSLGFDQDKQLDLIDSIVRKELKEPATTMAHATGEDIPNIVKMLENPESLIGNVINMDTGVVTEPTPQQHIQFTNDAALLDDADLLDGLANAEDGLTEDLLQHVAKLVEDKNLQEVIDKQVLGVATVAATMAPSKINQLIDTTATITTTISRPNVVMNISMSPHMQLQQQQQQQQQQSTLSLSPMTPRSKEPIKIVRSDGRVITLPPIEAPTTRGAKRRAQNQSTPEPSKRRFEEELTVRTSSTPKGVTKEKERRHSVSQKKVSDVDRMSAASKKPLFNEHNDDEDDDDELDDESDGSYNSEDDPFRLWCICRQPHNNRFMICCDKCEDWFHGKCVNITKAMGKEIEERGVEWVCPNCLKVQLGEKITTDNTTFIPLGPKSTGPIGSDLSIPLSCIVCKNVARPNSIYCSDDCIRRHAQTTAFSFVSQTEPSELDARSSSNEPAVRKKIISITPTSKTDNSKGKNRVIVIEKRTGRFLTGNNAPTVDGLKQWLIEHPTFEVVNSGSTQAVAIKAKQLQLKQLAKDMHDDKQNKLFSVGDQKIQTTLKVGPQKKIILVNPQKHFITISQSSSSAVSTMMTTMTTTATTTSTATTSIKQTPALQPLKITKLTQSTIQQKSPNASIKAQVSSPKTPLTPKVLTPTTNVTPKLGGQSSGAAKNKRKSNVGSAPTFVNRGQPEPVRLSVQRTLKEQLLLRATEVTDKSFIKLTDDEIGKFALDTELEIFNLFNKDTGSKYRAKYRSLMFNIKDRKNQTLFQKICRKEISPVQLVRMSPEELASQELAMWRENEAKHQLEMIKKSELDLLACAKNYVLKTHKGEEVIESTISDRVTLDPSISVEDVVSVLNNSAVSSTSENIHDTSTSSGKDNRIDNRFDNKYTSVDSSNSNAANVNKSSSSISDVVIKKKDNGRSRSRSHDRYDSKKSTSSKHKRRKSKDRRSRSRDRDRSKQEKRDRSKERDRERDRDRDKHRERERDRDRGISSDAKKKNDIKEKDKSKSTSTTASIKKTISKTDSMDSISKEPPKPMKKQENCNLIDKILEAQTTIDRILQPDEIKQTEDEQSTTTKSSTIAQPETDVKKTGSESDQEPTSTVIIPTPPERTSAMNVKNSPTPDAFMWSGSIIMVDLATFQIGVQPASGDCTEIAKELPTELDVVGRINPDIVWDYISKIKKSANKEILILKFVELSAEERDAYYTLYRYLYTRKRLGVIKSASPYIKDFYVAPLARHKSLPSVLTPLNGPGFGTERGDILIGIIVKINSPAVKRPTTIPVKVVRVPVTATVVPSAKPKSKLTTTKDEHYTPPGSPKIRLPSKVALPIFPKAKDNPPPPADDDGDEPYSPGGSDNDDIYVPPKITAPSSIQSMTSIIQPKPAADGTLMSPTQTEQEIQRKMDELTRQIEAQKMEIAGMLGPHAAEDEPYSPTGGNSPTIDHQSTSSGTAAAAIPTALANISIPSNLQEILNSIKNVKSGSVSDQITGQTTLAVDAANDLTHIPGLNTLLPDQNFQSNSFSLSALQTQTITIDDDDDDDNDVNDNVGDADGVTEVEEYTPVAVKSTSYKPSADYIPSNSIYKHDITGINTLNPPSSLSSTSSAPSKLAQLTDDELLSMVPDDLKSDLLPPPEKRAKYSYESPPATASTAPPGLQNEYVP